MDRRIRPWINKKIIEYIGEEEATLVDFVCSKVSVDVSISIYVKSDFLALYKRGFVILQVMAHSTPAGILDDVAMESSVVKNILIFAVTP